MPDRTLASKTAFHRTSVVKVALLAIMLLAGAVTEALAAGSISGHVSSSSPVAALPGTVIQFYDLNGNTDGPSATTTANGSGDYTMSLPPGSYAVFTQNTGGFINEIWNNIPCSAVCDTNSITPLDVTTTAITGIDFVLDPGTRISGTITSSAGGAPVPNITVNFADPGANVFFTTAVTDSLGNYTTPGGSATGNVFAVTANTQGYRNEVYDNIYCLNCNPVAIGTPIAVTLGTPKTGIDFILDPGGRITGSVTDSTPTPLANVHIRIDNQNGNTVDETDTDGSGNFSTAGLPTGNYYAKTQNTLGLVDKIWNNVICAGSNCQSNNIGATQISVTSPSTTGGITFVLPAGGYISGTVTNANGGAPIQDTFVGLTNSSGTFVGGGYTNALGVYTTPAVPAGTYYAVVNNVPGFIGQVYNGVACAPCNPVTAGTPIVVTVGTTQTGKDFALVAGGAITGTVVDTSLAPVSNFQVQVFSSGGQQLFQVNTNASGVYTFSGLASGSYYVRTAGGGNLINQLYNGVTCVFCNVTTSGGSLVSVAAPSTTSGVNFTLTTGGRISGTVTNAAGGAPISGVQVQVFNASNVQVVGASTNASGVYTTAGLPAGTYYLRTSNAVGFVHELYDNLPCPGSSCTATAGTPVTVTAGATTSGKDFGLVAGGQISGTVTNAVGGAPLNNVSVQVFNSTGGGLGSVNTNASGNYLTSGFPDGTYYLKTFNSQGFTDELYDDIPCAGCTVTTGTPIVITGGAPQTGKNFALAAGGSISGTVKDAGTLAVLGSVSVNVYTSGGVFVRGSATNGSGIYTVSGLAPGTYFARTGVSGTVYYFDELYNELPCAPGCTVTTGQAIVVTAGNTQSGVDFTLTSGAGTIGGTVIHAGTLAALSSANVQVYSSGGSFLKSANTNASGVYSIAGLAPGTYYVRTSLGSGYIDKLYNDLPCFLTCTVTAGTPVVVTGGATTGSIDFALRSNLVQNGGFNNGTTGWQLFATPDLSYITSSVVSGVFEYTRVAPPPGTSNQAVIFQTTGVALAAQAPVFAQFDLGNSSTVRKRVSVLVLDADFSDLSVCTFWLPPNAPLRTYRMRTHTTKAWTNAAIYFYAATAGANGGSYRLDNVALAYAPSQSAGRTDCVDPTAPTPPGGAASATMLTNGDFGTGNLTGWGTFGTITQQITGGVFEFIKPSGTPPAGVVLQATGQAATTNEILTANFQLGNSSGVRKRVTVLLHDNSFGDLSACTFWLAPGQALSNYTVRSFATSAWTNATFSVYPATVGPDQWIQLDNATLQRTPGATAQGTECGEPGVAPLP